MPYCAVPTIAARLQIVSASPGQPVHSIVLNCQVQIEPLGRSYTAAEESRLLDLFGERERWAVTMKPLLWTNAIVKVPGFERKTAVDLPLPCTMDFDVAATKYFYGLDAGHISVSVLFSGTIFYAGDGGALQVAQVPWDLEARFHLPVEAWKQAIGAHYPNMNWLRLPKETFERLHRYKVARGIPSWERAMERLLDAAEQTEVRDALKTPVGAEP
jgi:hypothetical protein